MNKRGQQSSIGMSFGMIFSIFLIVVFIVIAVIAVKIFFDFGNKADVGMFKDELQVAVNNAWKGQASEFTFKINLPKGIEQVCFANLSANNVAVGSPQYKIIERYSGYPHNLFLSPPEKALEFEHWNVENINITKITRLKNPYCVKSDATLKISKDF